MRRKKATKKNKVSAVKNFPKIKCTAPWRVTKVKVLDGYRLAVTFKDGARGFVDMSARVKSKKAGVFSVLKNKKLFDQVFLQFGAVTWPGEIDLAPDTMHDAIKKNGEWVLK